MLVLAVTLHNIPEGLAVGVAFGELSRNSRCITSSGLNISFRNRTTKLSRRSSSFSSIKKGRSIKNKKLLYGQISGLVEPIAGVIGVLAALTVRNILPFLLSFSAGAMIAVVGAELLPEASMGKQEAYHIRPYFRIYCNDGIDVALG